MKMILILAFLFTLSCARSLESFVLPVPITYPEEKRVLDYYPIEPVKVETIND